MKIKNVYLALFAVMALFMSSCTNNEYAKLIPKDAVFVMRLDVKQTVEKCGLQENKNIKRSVTDVLKESDLSRDLRDRIEQIFEKPATSGLDLRQPVYFYVSQDGMNEEAAIVGALHSKGDFADLINSYAKDADCDKVKETNEDIRYFSDDNFCIVFNDNWFFMGNKESKIDADDFANDLAKKIEHKDTKSFVDTESFKKLDSSSGVAQLLFNGEGFSTIISKREKRELKKALPAGVDIEDASYMIDLSIEKGEMTLTGEFIAMSDEWSKFIDRNDEKLGDVKGDLLKYISKDGLSVITNINGKQVFKTIKNIGSKEISSDDLDFFNRILSPVDGDLAINITDVNVEKQVPIMSAYIQTKDNSLVNTCEEMSEGKAQKVNNNEIVFNLSDTISESFNAYFGYRNNTTYVTTGESSTCFTPASNALSMDEIKGHKFYMRLGFAAIEKHVSSNRDNVSESLVRLIKNWTKIFDYAEMYYEGKGKTVLRLVTKDKTNTPAASLINFIFDNSEALSSISLGLPQSRELTEEELRAELDSLNESIYLDSLNKSLYSDYDTLYSDTCL